jgi:3-isopropylmalate/(R)-2-methylmalate dehydratase large subunit
VLLAGHMASRIEYMKLLRTGLVELSMETGAIVESPCCGPCMGGSFELRVTVRSACQV